ncbi:MAG TPA: class I SAM-dependent methyltransferase [Candidatus Limnocylindria bacterium]|nr:class I SAM-dependent methyltransferase [Candidatus Limnocylindria bacterium]
MSGDIFAGQPTAAELLAELYDIEHDAVTEDHAFYREMGRRHPRAALDLGCGSGRLFAPLLQGGVDRLLGVDGSPALLRRAEERIERDPLLAQARAAGRLALTLADVRRLDRRAVRAALGTAASLVVVSGVLPHLDGPEEALRLLVGVAAVLDGNGVAVLDDIGPGQLPERDLPLSLDWRRVVDGREIVRRSQLMRHEAPEGLRVVFSTIVDLGRPDGTIARLPASHRLWYPSADTLRTLVREAGLAEELTYGSHDLDPLEDDSERRILLVRRAAG